MVQISFKLAVMATTTVVKRDATTSGPIKLPHWAPDIRYMSTTTIHDHASGFHMPATTWNVVNAINPNGGYNTRCFGLKDTDYSNEAGDVITMRYAAVGELSRTE